VFTRLTNAFTNSRPSPQLQLIARSRNKDTTIAQYESSPQPRVLLDEEVYDLCTTLGQDSLNALAVLLGHELAHHYQQHEWSDTYGTRKARSNYIKEAWELEEQADFYSCFYGELAGFATGTVFPRILDLVYRQYRLENQLPGYPSKEERKKVYQLKHAEAAQMASIFKAGQFLYLTGEHQAAAQFFNYLANKFPSRDILSNLAASKLQQVLELIGQRNPPFAYPIELDARTRLTTRHRSPLTRQQQSAVNNLLKQARQHAEQARQADPSYVPAYINLACIRSLQGNHAAAVGVINDLGTDHLTADAHTIRAIAFYQDTRLDQDSRLEQARKDFEAASRQRGYQADYNLAVFRKLEGSSVANLTNWAKNWITRNWQQPSTFRKAPVHPNIKEDEHIGGIKANAPFPPQIPVVISEEPSYYLTLQWLPTTHHYARLRIQLPKYAYQITYTSENYPGQTIKRVARGASGNALKERYGEPSLIMAAAEGAFWMYKSKGIIFKLTDMDRVASWCIYAKGLR
jgi:hypothetical protein